MDVPENTVFVYLAAGSQQSMGPASAAIGNLHLRPVAYSNLPELEDEATHVAISSLKDDLTQARLLICVIADISVLEQKMDFTREMLARATYHGLHIVIYLLSPGQQTRAVKLLGLEGILDRVEIKAVTSNDELSSNISTFLKAWFSLSTQ